MSLDWLHDYVARWHDTWEVVGAIATAAAVVVALMGISTERQARIAAQKDADKAREDLRGIRLRERRSQAVRVAATAYVEQDALSADLEIRHWIIIQVTNQSDAPIKNVSASVRTRDSGGWDVVEVATSILATRHASGRSGPRPYAPRDPIEFSIWFTDAHDARWRLTHEGDVFEEAS